MELFLSASLRPRCLGFAIFNGCSAGILRKKIKKTSTDARGRCFERDKYLPISKDDNLDALLFQALTTKGILPTLPGTP
ncbi:hypothetical protein DSCO28_47690 [Desulfosarcina ovata subsp. sediminis]|uniref:Uncharacterized protein n=1 Tax=Desulfosarcina ovata subsp. sediminis TaxID=885957 RepID=A0A5K7ZVD6_9BACT|nr:hypothetical protein DSCO28_47690 [Desulfosarcina ovata subsp. sediminis]